VEKMVSTIDALCHFICP